MKKILFLLLFPCLACAQYQGNANQKITLGEQTTADGLVYRGVASIDTVTATSKITRANKQDTSAFLLLDTTTNLLWHYKTGSNAWTQAGGGVSVSSFSAGTTGLTPSTATTGAVTLGGTLAVANGGTGASVRTFVDTINTQTVNGAKTFTSAVTATRFNPTSTTATGTGMYLPATNTLGFSTNGVERVRIKSDGNVGYGTNNPVSLLHIEKAGGTTFAFGDQFRVSSGTSGNRAEFHLTDNVTSDAFISFLPSSTASSRYLEITTNGAGGGISVDGNGRLGIGTVSPSALLNVMGTVRINSASAPDANYYLQLENSASQKAKANAWDTYSDKRIKTDIQPIFNAIDKVNLLNPVYYQKHDSYVENDFLNIDYDNSVKSLGFIAQEVYNIIPEAVNTGTTNELWAMDYTKIIPILTKAIQEQNAFIKALEQRLLILENK